jgi:hypothetical protein
LWLIGCFAVTLGSVSGVWADDPWQSHSGLDSLRPGLDSLRPLQGVEPFAAFLNPQQTNSSQQESVVEPLLPDPGQTDPLLDDSAELMKDSSKSALMESYDDWLDESEYKGVPRVREGRFALPALLAPSIATDTIGNGRTPRGFRAGDAGPTRPLPETSEYRGTQSWTLACWAAANTYSNPRYFEDRMLERHGHERCPPLTPVISGARFFTGIAMLPYLMTVSPPCREESTLGYFRSGSAAPALKQRPPYDRRALLVEVAAIAAAFLALP